MEKRAWYLNDADKIGGIFANGARTAAYIAAVAEAPGLYKKWVGYDLDIGPGGDAAQKTETSPPVEGANNIGVQGGDITDPCFACENGPVSKTLNNVPLINATSGLHDTWQIGLGTGLTRDVLNVPLMFPAFGVTAIGAMGQAIQSLSTAQIVQIAYSSGMHLGSNLALCAFD